jgi:hypothetical protein
MVWLIEEIFCMKNTKILLLPLVIASSLCIASETSMEDSVKKLGEQLHVVAENCDKMSENELSQAIRNLSKAGLTFKQQQEAFGYEKNGKNVIASAKLSNGEIGKEYLQFLKINTMIFDGVVHVLKLGDVRFEDARDNEEVKGKIDRFMSYVISEAKASE